MRFKVIMLALAALVATSSLTAAQQLTGEIFGKVTDSSGAVLPGVTVTLTGPSLLQPLTATTSETGSYQFPRLSIGIYNVKFELAGFKTVVKEGIRVTVGFSANVSTQLGVSTVQETVTVTGESPIVDTKQTGTKQTFTLEQLQSIPSARDPWVILQQTAGIAMDRENIGGNMSGQQSNYISRGGNPTNNKWSLDGVDITDMSATGASPSYYDFDSFQEMTINTGGVDVTQQTGGVGINLVTKSGTDRFRARRATTSPTRTFQSNNITDELRAPGRDLGQPDPEHQGLRRRSRRPDPHGPRLGVGQLRQADRRRRRRRLLQADAGLPGVQDHRGRARRVDRGRQRLPQHRPHAAAADDNLKGEVQLFKGNKLSLFNNFAKKERNARGASRPEPDRDDHAAEGGRQELRQVPVEHRAEPDLQVRRPVGGQRSAAARPAVRARRQQLHARPAVAGPARRCSRRSSSRPA